MSKKLKNIGSETSQKKLLLLKTLNSKIRLKVILLLFIYQKLYLWQLPDKLGRTKNTIIYHMKMLSREGFVDEFDEKIPNSIKPIKYYRINGEFLKSVFQPFEDPSNLSDDEILEYSRNILKWNSVLFETIREFLKELNDFFQSSEKNIKNPTQARKFHQENTTPRDLVPLSEQGYAEYTKNYRNLMEKMVSFLDHENKNTPDILRPYLVFNAILPIKTLVEVGIEDRTKSENKNKD
ncbi:MAG: hypothetical protein ACTSVU_09635 [Promethearchaeota archaeon]